MDFINTFIEKKLNKKITQQPPQRIWALALMEKWFCTWQFSDNRKK